MTREAYILTTCRASGGSLSNPAFKWPQQGSVVCPDWSPDPECGSGIHGLLMGMGASPWLDNPLNPATRWVVAEVDPDRVVDLRWGKVKVPEAQVVFYGDRHPALNFLASKVMQSFAPLFRGTSWACHYGTAIAGDYGKAIAGDYGKAVVGRGGKATVGNWGFAITGPYGTAAAGEGGVAVAGEGGEIRIRWWNGRYRTVVGYVGEDGIKINTPYCETDGKLTPYLGKLER